MSSADCIFYWLYGGTVVGVQKRRLTPPAVQSAPVFPRTRPTHSRKISWLEFTEAGLEYEKKERTKAGIRAEAEDALTWRLRR